MSNPYIAIEKLQRLKSVNPDGQYFITMTASGYYRVVDAEEKTAQPLDVDSLLPNIASHTTAELLDDY